MKDSIGIIGFGTVGAVLAEIFTTSGIAVVVYDILMEDPIHDKAITNKAIKYNAALVSLPDLISQSKYVISTVTTQIAEEIAHQCLPYLKEDQFYLDCNSTSSGIKINIQKIIESGKAHFIEGVIINAVHPGDATIEMLTGGKKGEDIADFLQQNNIKARFYAKEVGKASLFKMLRSIFSKGVEVLIIEMLVAAKKAGIENNLWQEIISFMDSKSFEIIGESWIKSHAVAYERRCHEMEQVIDTMNELGVSPILTQATLQYFKQSITLDLKSFFPSAPSHADEVITVIAREVSKSNP